jgi:hypothetical protein
VIGMGMIKRELGMERRLLWIVLLTAASVVMSGVYACATPFAALGAIAALDSNRRDGLILIGIIWLANQIVGFGFLGYPHEAQAYGWGLAILAAAVVGFLAARVLVTAIAPVNVLATIGGAFLVAFVGYQLGLFAATTVLPSSPGAFSYAVVSYVATVNGIAFVALLALHWLASMVGLVERNAVEARLGAVA